MGSTAFRYSIRVMDAVPISHTSLSVSMATDGQVQKSLSEDTTKKYTEEGMDLVETLKRRYVRPPY